MTRSNKRTLSGLTVESVVVNNQSPPENTDNAPYCSAGNAEQPECGPHCRPSCLTFLLDLDRYVETESCLYQSNTWDACEAHCGTEAASCFGPDIYARHPNAPCTIPLERYQGWPVASRLSNMNCGDNETPCFGSSNNQHYFEYCNVVREECGDDGDCTRYTAPLPDGHSTIVVLIDLPDKCFVQRISLYYPEQCDTCHDCSLLQLGDRFGNLELVGFGHSIAQPCASCDVESAQLSSPKDALDCSEIQQCHETVDCTTGDSLELPPFSSQCSFTSDLFGEAGTITGDSYNPDNNITGNPDNNITDNGFADDLEVTVNITLPETKAPFSVNGTQAPNTAPSTASNNSLISNLVVSLPIAGALLLITLLAFYLFRRNRRIKADRQRQSGEEIVYIHPIDDNVVNKVLAQDSEDDRSAKDEKSQQSDSVSLNETETPTPHLAEYRTTSLMEHPSRDEVEAIHMTGTHVLQRSSTGYERRSWRNQAPPHEDV